MAVVTFTTTVPNVLHCFTHPLQLTQWRQFEEDQNNPSQMAKYFSSPSKSQPSVYSQDEVYYLLGENSSMKKLLNEVLHCFSHKIYYTIRKPCRILDTIPTNTFLIILRCRYVF